MPLTKQSTVSLFFKNKFKNVGGPRQPSEADLEKFVKSPGKQGEMAPPPSDEHSALKKPGKEHEQESANRPPPTLRANTPAEQGLAKL